MIILYPCKEESLYSFLIAKFETCSTLTNKICWDTLKHKNSNCNNINRIAYLSYCHPLSEENSKLHGQTLITQSFLSENNYINYNSWLKLEQKYTKLSTVCEYKKWETKKYQDTFLCFYKNITLFCHQCMFL